MANSSEADRAARLILSSRYMSLATASPGARPWVAPVAYVETDHGQLLFSSPKSSRHGEHVAANTASAIAIFNSRAPSEEAYGLQVEGLTTVIAENDLPHYGEVFHQRYAIKADAEAPDWHPEHAARWRGDSPHRLYLFTATRLYELDDDEFKRSGVDQRRDLSVTEVWEHVTAHWRSQSDEQLASTTTTPNLDFRCVFRPCRLSQNGLGVDYAQGYEIARPQPLEQILGRKPPPTSA